MDLLESLKRILNNKFNEYNNSLNYGYSYYIYKLHVPQHICFVLDNDYDNVIEDDLLEAASVTHLSIVLEYNIKYCCESIYSPNEEPDIKYFDTEDELIKVMPIYSKSITEFITNNLRYIIPTKIKSAIND